MLNATSRSARRYRYRKRHEAEEDGNGGGGDQRQGEGDGNKERRGRDHATELTAVAAVTAAARAVEEELRAQLEAKDQALRRVSIPLFPAERLRRKKSSASG